MDNEKEKEDEEKDQEQSYQKDLVHQSLQQPPYLPFIQSDDKFRDKVLILTNHVEDFKNQGHTMKTEHDTHIKLIYEELKAQEELVHSLNGQTTSLLGSICKSSSKIQTTHDKFLFE